jgi:DNA-binding CsgD family transcriptional regulator
MDNSKSYNLFLKFLKTYSPVGFLGINRDDSLMTELENMMEENNQFFYVADLIQMKVLFTSMRSTQMIGIEPAEVNPYHFMEAMHPDDIQRYNLARAKVIKTGQELYIEGKGDSFVSTNIKLRTPGGAYSSFLIQNYSFYVSSPYKTVFYFKLHTNIDWFKKIKHGYHYYIGNDMSYFRFPDEALLNTGNVFSDREIEIIRLILSGLSTEQIAKKIFLSPYTVNTHRGNILKKTGKANIAELIYELKERGVL